MIGAVLKKIPIGEFAYRINLISAIAAAVTVANVYLLLRLWLMKNMPAIIGAASLAVSWTFWQHAAIAEVYTLYTAMLSAELLMLLGYCKTRRPRYLYLLALLNGLSIANHNLGVMPLVCYLVFAGYLAAKKEIRPGQLALASLLWIAGVMPYGYLVIEQWAQTGDLMGTLSSAAFGQGYQNSVLNAAVSASVIKQNVIFILYNFPTPNILLAAVGLTVLYRLAPRKGFANVVAGLLVLFLLFAFRYDVPDRYGFFIPFYCLLAVLIGLGADALLRCRPGRTTAVVLAAMTLLAVPVYMVAAPLAEKAKVNLGTRIDIPYRNAYKWFLQPWQGGYRGPETFADEALGLMEKNALIYADGTTVYPLLYAQQVHQKRNDIAIVSGPRHHSGPNTPIFDERTIGKILTERPVYIVTPQKGYCPLFLLDRCEFERAGCIWRAVPKTKALIP